VVTTLNAIDYWLAGSLKPEVFHWHIYLEFVLLLVLLYFFFLKTFRLVDGKHHRLVALLGTAFFAFHTPTAETINYIISRSDGFSTLMVLAGTLIYISGSGWKKQLGLLPFIIGSLAKPTTLMLAPILFVFDLLLENPSMLVRNERFNLPRLRTIVQNTALYFVAGAVMYKFTRSMFSPTWLPSNISAADYLNTQPYVMWIYVKTFFFPVSLTADTDLELIKKWSDPRVLGGLAIIGLMLAVAYRAARKRQTLPISFGILWFFIALVPSSSVIPLAEPMNHHRTFFPYIGLVMALAWGVYLAFEKVTNGKPSTTAKASLAGFIMLVLGANAYGTYQRNEVWDNDESLWYDVTIRSPKNGRGLMNYGLTEMRKGNLESAISYFEAATHTGYGRHPYLYTNLGVAKNSLAGQRNDPALRQEAERYLREAVRIGHNYPECHYHLGNWLAANGKVDEAVSELNKALEQSPGHTQARMLLQALTRTAAEGLKIAEEAAYQQNTPESYLELSLKYYNNGQYDNCIKACETALKLRPNYAEAYNNICSAYNKLKQFDKAIVACEKALSISPNYALAQGNLNWARSQKGQ
jgi:tetratricopeptide (TPR) repeat protein